MNPNSTMHVCRSKPSGPFTCRKFVPIKRLCTSPLKSCSGFTLVEILLAMFIFAIVMSIIFTSYTATFRIIDETENQADVYRMARVTLERMYEDLESVYAAKPSEPPESEEESNQVVEFVGEEAEINGRRAHSLRFTSRAHVVFSEQDQPSGTAEISYYIEENDAEDNFVLYRKDTPRVGRAPDRDAGGLVLCEKLQSVTFFYYDAEGDVYDNWDSTSEEFEDRIPRRVSIILEFANESDPEAPFRFLTTVALPMGVEKEST